MADQPDLQNMSPEEIAEYQRQNCIFCKIIKGEIPSKKVFEDDKLIAILDINPAVKGHALMMTKEHYPILPIIPLDVAGHMFRITRDMSKALKNAMITHNSTVFIANGAVAGQQSPHFLYHLIPREEGDGLDNFNIPVNDFKEEEVKQHLAALKGKIGLMMREYRNKTGGGSEKKSEEPVTQQDLAKFIDSNPDVKKMIIEDPEEFKKKIETDDKLKQLFAGINIAKLAIALKSLNQGKK